MFDSVSKALATAKFKFIAESPTLAIGAGVVGLGASIFLASRATLKAQHVVEEHKANLIQIEADYQMIKDDKDKNGNIKFTEKDYQHQQVGVLLQTAGKLIKLYGPTIAIAGLSIASIVYGRNVFQNRLTSLSAAYSVVSSTLEAYRARVKEELGEEKESVVYAETIEQKAAKFADSDKKISKKDPYATSVYARFFDEASPCWTSRSSENRFLLHNTIQLYNDILYRRGYVFLNEIYEHLGLEPSPEGQVIGWIRDDAQPKSIDFGLNNIEREAVRRFMNDDEPSVLLDFNVDGYILDKI